MKTGFSVVAVLLSGMVVGAWAADPPPAPVAQSPLDRLCENLSPGGLVTNMANEMIQTVPAARRADAMAAFIRYVDMDEVEQVMRKVFRETCTPEELNALADMCATAAGRSALQKYMLSMERVMAGLQPEFVKAHGRVMEDLKKK